MKQKRNDVETLLEDLTNFFVKFMEIRFKEKQLKAFLMEMYGFENRQIAPRLEYLHGVGLLHSISEKNEIVELDVEMLLSRVSAEYALLIRGVLKEIDEFDSKRKLESIKEAEKDAKPSA
jgi:hypothetical protein